MYIIDIIDYLRSQLRANVLQYHLLIEMTNIY